MYDADEQSVDLIKQKRMRSDDFILIKCIGRGAFGEVQLVCSLVQFSLVIFILSEQYNYKDH